MSVVLHPEAVSDARAARDWYAERSGLAAAAFLTELDAAVDQIGRAPDAWPLYARASG
jgi:plasmid stabilization system protein ParE